MPDVPPPDAPDREPAERPVPLPPTTPAGPPGGQVQGLPSYPGHGTGTGSAPGAPSPGTDPEGSRTKAVWALVLAIVPLCVTWIAAVVLAIIVLAGPRDGRRRGRPMAWSALGVVALWVVASIIATVVIVASAGADRDDAGDGSPDRDDASVPSDRDEPGEDTFEEEVLAEDLQVGDCLAEDLENGEEEVFTVSARSCDEPHNAEVFHEFDLDEGDYPDESDIWDIADEGCYAAFEPWVGQSYEDSELEFSYYYPTRQSWKYDDRAVSCLVLAPDDVTGTLQGSGR